MDVAELNKIITADDNVDLVVVCRLPVKVTIKKGVVEKAEFCDAAPGAMWHHDGRWAGRWDDRYVQRMKFHIETSCGHNLSHPDYDPENPILTACYDFTVQPDWA
jgi:hypothetical protein